MHLTSVISLIIAALGAAVVAKWMPGRQPATPLAAEPVPAAASASATASRGEAT